MRTTRLAAPEPWIVSWLGQQVVLVGGLSTGTGKTSSSIRDSDEMVFISESRGGSLPRLSLKLQTNFKFDVV
jgi:hypothetical protein